MKELVGAFNQEKALVVITNLRMELFQALVGGFFRFGIKYLHILLSKQTRQLSPLERDVEEAPLDSV